MKILVVISFYVDVKQIKLLWMTLQAVEVDAAADVTTEKSFPIPIATPEIGILTNRERRKQSKFLT